MPQNTYVDNSSNLNENNCVKIFVIYTYTNYIYLRVKFYKNHVFII